MEDSGESELGLGSALSIIGKHFLNPQFGRRVQLKSLDKGTPIVGLRSRLERLDNRDSVFLR